MPQATRPSSSSAAAAGVQTAGAGAGTAARAAGTAAVTAGGALATSAGAAVIMAGLVTFLASLRRQQTEWLTRELGRYSSSVADIRRVVAEEDRRGVEFARRSADRVASALPQALVIADPKEREARVRQIMADEDRYARQRAEAMLARAIAAVGRLQLRRDSPLGAFWRLGVAVNHTHGCKFMAGKFWPWPVLDRVHPPRHYGCTSSLHGFGEAIHEGWMTAADVPDTREAVRAAAGVVMEQEQAQAIERELELRDQLVEAGADASVIAELPFEGVSELPIAMPPAPPAIVREAFSSALHPRGAGGQWATKPKQQQADQPQPVAKVREEQARDRNRKRVLAILGASLHVSQPKGPEAQQVIDDLGYLPPALARWLKASGAQLYVGSVGLTKLDGLSYLSSQSVAGYPPGFSWDQVGALEIDGTPTSPPVIAIGGQGSNVAFVERDLVRGQVLHELAHVLTKIPKPPATVAIADMPGWVALHRRIFSRLDPYEQQDGPGGLRGRQECIADLIGALLVSERQARAVYGDAAVSWVKQQLGLP